MLVLASALFIYIAEFLVSTASPGERKTRWDMEYTILASFTPHHTSEIKKLCCNVLLPKQW